MIQDYLNLENGQIFYTISGIGNPLLFLHGNFTDHHIWNDQLDSFSTRYQVIRYDLRGYGLSSTPNTSFSNVEDLKALIDALKLPNVTLIGSSSGGGIAVDFTLTYPDLVQALILVSPSLGGNSYPLNMTWQVIKNYFNVRLKGREAAVEAFITNHFWQYFFPSLTKEEARKKVLNNVRNTSNFCRFSPNLTTAMRPYAIARLREINIPTLVIVSDQDHPFNMKTAETLHTNINLSSKVIMQDCGHLPFVEEPHEFNQMVLNFLSTEVRFY